MQMLSNELLFTMKMSCCCQSMNKPDTAWELQRTEKVMVQSWDIDGSIKQSNKIR
jgi:hypothetical protein